VPLVDLYVGCSMPTTNRDEEFAKVRGILPLPARQKKASSMPQHSFSITVNPDAALLHAALLDSKEPSDEKSADTLKDSPVGKYYPAEVWQDVVTVQPGFGAQWRAILSQDVGCGPRWLDVYVWSVLLDDAKLSRTLLLGCEEPMRAAIIGARLALHMCHKLPLQAVSLLKRAEEHELWATHLLDLCQNAGDARSACSKRPTRVGITTCSLWP
jgi:hypothetical protein